MNFFQEKRVFGDKVYYLDATTEFLPKHEAERLAERYRKDGHLARVVERGGKGNYCVYFYKRSGYKKMWKKR